MKKPFTPKEEKMVGLLMEMELSRSLARILVYFSRSDACVCNDIKKATNLRQPEVSMAMQYLKERGWIVAEPLHRERKGRPINNYKLAIPFDKIIDTLIREEQARIKDIRTKLRVLKEMAK